MVFTLPCISSLLDAHATAVARVRARHDAHIPSVAAVVLDNLSSAHFELVEGAGSRVRQVSGKVYPVKEGS